MRGLMTCGLIVGALTAVIVAEPTSRPAEESRTNKKLIEFGWDEPDTAFMRKHTAQMDATPFDGCVYHLRVLQADGKDADFIWACWGRQAFTIEQVQHAIDDLKATRFKRLRHNFLRFNVTPGDLDWFDDYSAVINNARHVVFVAAGLRKKAILSEVLGPGAHRKGLPAELVKPSGGDVQWLVDAAAAGDLNKQYPPVL